MNELITIVINVYNGEKFIKKCLDSAINQTYRNLEILIINDGSTDKTLEICKKYKDKRIRIINTKNLGLSLSRNVGIDNSKGEYLYFIDVDDFIEEDTIEYLYKLIKKHKVKMATCGTLEIYKYDFNKPVKKEKIEVLTDKQMLEKNVLSIDYAINLWNKLMSKDLFRNIRFENRIINDLAVTYKLIIESREIVNSNQIKYYYLRNIKSISIKNKTEYYRNIDIYNVSVERYNNIKKIYPDFLANDIGLLRNIVFLYTKQNKKMHKYLDSIGVKKLYKEIFSIKILGYKMKKKDKIIIILFRISPKLYSVLLKVYLKIKKSKF